MINYSMDKPMCKYGRKCYRRNPDHFKEFSHPDDRMDDPPRKKQKTDLSKDLIPEEFNIHTPPLFYLTKVRGINPHFNQPSIAVGIGDLLSESMGDLVCSAQFNYLIDIPWLIQQYPESKRSAPMLIVYGDQRDTNLQMRKDAQPFPNISLFPARLEIMFGTHHSKMMLLKYQTGVRIIIHTANLIAKDWNQKTQGVWISPVFPPLSDANSSSKDTPTTSDQPPAQSSAATAHDSSFQADLLDYLDVYGGSALDEWRKWIRSHDMSSARVRLVASVPGSHTGSRMHKWGHLKLKRVLSECLPEGVADEQWPVVGQFSSIGSLGPTSASWLCSEWLQSLSATKKASKSPLGQHRTPGLQLIFPTVENVRQSMEGYMAGGSIPYPFQNAQKQAYLKAHFCQWRADCTGRSRAAPHIKTYTRLSPECNKALWFLLTSANLSKAAWGCLEKKGTQLKIRSYEIGVLFLPSDINPSTTIFSLSSTTSLDEAKESVGTSSTSLQFIPYDLPLTGYSAKDEPWVWNTPHREPDCHGNIWTPPR